MLKNYERAWILKILPRSALYHVSLAHGTTEAGVEAQFRVDLGEACPDVHRWN